MAVFSLAALASEIQTDPTAQGYAALVSAGNRLGIANKLNAINAVNQVKRVDIRASEILEAIDVADVITSANAVAVSWFESATQQATLRLTADDGQDTRILKNIKSLFLANGAAGANPQTRARLNAIALRDGSRAELLWGAGIKITDQHIADAGF